jgi:surface polysaccharide O-acyltransferase-like enzyme
VLAHFAERARGDAVVYLLLLWGLTASAQSIASLFGIQLGITIPAIAGYSGYFMLGRMLRDTAISGRMIPHCTLVAIAAWLITLVGTYWLTSRAGHLDEFAFGYGSPNVIAMTLGSYLVLASQPVRHFIAAHERLTHKARKGAELTLGIFLVHPLLLQLVLPQLHLDWNTGGPLIGVPLTTVVTLCLSAAIVAGLNRIPILRSAIS